MHLAAKELVRIKMSTPYCNHTLRTESTAAVRGTQRCDHVQRAADARCSCMTRRWLACILGRNQRWIDGEQEKNGQT